MYSNQPQLPIPDATNVVQQRPPGAKNEPQRYSAPHPNMYPIPPPAMSTFPTQPVPIEAYQHMPLPAGARFISPPRFPTADELKYKCSVCGRFRSPRYHYRHPIPPGELPKATVCRRCREEATDSENSDSFEKRRPRARSRSVSRVVRARSFRRGDDILPRRYTRSRSSSREPRQIRVVDEEGPVHRSSDVEIVRYVPSRRERRSAAETIYVEDNRRHHRSGSSYEDDLYIVSDDEYDCPPR